MIQTPAIRESILKRLIPTEPNFLQMQFNNKLIDLKNRILAMRVNITVS
jgi:hypothetical protein